MPSEERDRQFERALQRHLGGGASDASCPDAEILAAYHERTLSLEELTQWKEHISGCARCQETLALLEQTNEVATEERQSKELVTHATLAAREVPSDGSSQISARAASTGLEADAPTTPIALQQKKKVRSSLRWAVPVGALAAGVLIFVTVRETGMRPASSMQTIQMAENRQAAPPQPPASLDRMDEAQREKKLMEPSQSLTDALKKSQGESISPPKISTAPRMPSPNEASSYAAGASEGDRQVGEENEMARRLDVKPGVPRPNAAPTPNRTANSPAAVRMPPPPTPESAVAGGAIAQEQLDQAPAAKAKESSNARTMQQTEALSANTTVEGRKINSLHEIAAKNPHVIPAPDNKHAWRVGLAGSIEATSNAGVEWKSQTSGVNGELTGGSAPSEKICWVVGKSGTVLLTTDGGKHWKTIVSPLQEDLGGVHAVDAKHAAIWNVGNQKSFETGDGGLTWSATANE